MSVVESLFDLFKPCFSCIRQFYTFIFKLVLNDIFRSVNLIARRESRSNRAANLGYCASKSFSVQDWFESRSVWTACLTAGYCRCFWLHLLSGIPYDRQRVLLFWFLFYFIYEDNCKLAKNKRERSSKVEQIVTFFCLYWTT